MKKRVLYLILAMTMVVSLLTGCVSSGKENTTGSTSADIFKEVESQYKIALITDSGEITDQSFAQTTYEACKTFCAENSFSFEYYKPNENSTEQRVASVEKAINDGYNVIVMPGYAFATAIIEISAKYPNVKFIALDVAKGDLLEAAVPRTGQVYDYNPDNWNLEQYVYMDNVYCAVYQEEISGYMAGYAAVKMGYKNLGYVGGNAVPVVMRFGYGFIQGADAAATELGLQDVTIKYAYSNQFFGDAVITSAMDTWYQSGTEVVFACGGAIYTSVAEAASRVGGKVIGVDSDQSFVIDAAYGDGITITSAMKGLYPTAMDTLTDIVLNNKWTNYAGKITTLGLSSKTEVESNYVQLPLETTRWTSSFTENDYKMLVGKIYDGIANVSSDVSTMPVVNVVRVENLGNLK